MNLTIKHLDIETLHHHFGHTSDKVMYYFLTILKIQRRFIFQYKNMSAIVIFLKRYTNTVFLRTLFTPVSF